jgi:hypothetical protein
MTTLEQLDRKLYESVQAFAVPCLKFGLACMLLGKLIKSTNELGYFGLGYGFIQGSSNFLDVWNVKSSYYNEKLVLLDMMLMIGAIKE